MLSKIVFIKTRISFGGASLSDLELLSVAEELGFKIEILTGFIDPKINDFFFKNKNIEIKTLSLMDRYYEGNKNVSARKNVVEKFLLSETSQNDLLLVSQPFLRDGQFFSDTIVEMSKNRQCFLRLHDPIEDHKSYLKIDPKTIGIPTTHIMADWMMSINNKIKLRVIPPVINLDFFRSPGLNRLEIFEKYKIGAKDFVIFQPTRISSRKNIGRAVKLAKIISTKIKSAEVYLIIAGGNEIGKEKILEKTKLTKLASEIEFKNLIFLNNCLPDTISNYMKNSDLITFFSKTESWGKIPAESCAAGIPCITTNYKDENDKNVFEEVYGRFNFLVEQDPHSNKISEENINKIINIAHASQNWNKNRIQNLKLVIKYDKNEWKDTILKIFREIR